MKRIILKYYVFLFLPLILAVSFDRYERKPGGIIWSDAEGYYMYLPAAFIYGGFKDLKTRTKHNDGRDVYVPLEKTGRIHTKYTFGVALLETPFFLASHLLGIPRNEADGISLIYRYGLLVAAAVYCFLGLFFLKKTLERYFDPWPVFVVLCSLFCGTNLYYYSTVEVGMSHVYSFFAIGLWIYLLPGIFKRPGFGNFFWLGLLFGLIVLIRPTNFAAAIFFFGFGIKELDGWPAFLRFIQAHFTKFTVLALAPLVLFIPQVLLWHHMAGEWILYSYRSEPGFIYWKKPYFLSVLYHPQNGLFLYSPILLFFLAGLAVDIRKDRYYSRTVLLIFILITYLFGSWWRWFFGGAFGHRCYVEYLPFLAFPLAVFYNFIFKKWPIWAQLIVYLLALAMMFYTISLADIYFHNWDGPDWGWDDVWGKIKEAFSRKITCYFPGKSLSSF